MTTDTMSSKLMAAKIILGIPFWVPYPPDIKFRRIFTKMAGEVAPKEAPRTKHKINGALKIHLINPATAIPSVIIGVKQTKATVITDSPPK